MMRQREKEGDCRTSKIGGRRKRRAEKREGRKEGRTRASRRSGRRTHRSQAGQARNLSPSPSFSFDPRPRLLRAPLVRVAQPLFLFSSLSFSLFSFRSFSLVSACAALSSSLSTGRHRSPPPVVAPLHSSRHREPWPTAFFPAPSSTLPGRPPPRRLKPPFSPLLRARPCQTKTNYAAFSEPQRAPTSYTASFALPVFLFLLASHLRSRSSSTSFHGTHLLRRPTILTPLSSFLPRPPSPNHPPVSETLRYVGHQMGAQPLRTLCESVLSMESCCLLSLSLPPSWQPPQPAVSFTPRRPLLST